MEGLALSRTELTFLYLGRRGALGQFTRELMSAADRLSGDETRFIVSADGTFAQDSAGYGTRLSCVPTFARATPLSIVRNFVPARQRILEQLRRDRPSAVVTLMPHIWTPLLAPSIRALGIKYVPIIHDARPHPGDRTAWVTKWLLRDAKQGDVVVTLSKTVAEDLARQGLADPSRILPLFHPDLTFQSDRQAHSYQSERPLRLLFFGRVMAYKGLSLLIEAIEILRSQGLPVTLGLAGSGELGELRARLEALDAEIVNRWIDEQEVSAILSRYDAIACPHVEASQSGVVAAAFGHSMPVVAMPTGGIAEQVIDNRTGVLAENITAPALADAIRRLATEPGLYGSISTTLKETAAERSMDHFLGSIRRQVAAS